MSSKVQISLRTPLQLFDSRDPAPFLERDIDEDAEDYIVSYAQEVPQNPLHLELHFRERSNELSDETIKLALHHFFAYRADLQAVKLAQVFRLGRFAILTGLCVLVIALTASRLVPEHWWGASIAREGLVIIGWVAMWRPIDIFLYDWWPQILHRRLYRRLEKAQIKIKYS